MGAGFIPCYGYMVLFREWFILWGRGLCHDMAVLSEMSKHSKMVLFGALGQGFDYGGVICYVRHIKT